MRSPKISYERNEGLQHNPCDFKNEKIPSENIESTSYEDTFVKLGCEEVQLNKETSFLSTSDINGRGDFTKKFFEFEEENKVRSPNNSYERNEGLQHNPCDFKNEKIPSENYEDTSHEEAGLIVGCEEVKLRKETLFASNNVCIYSMNWNPSGICYIINISFSRQVKTQNEKLLCSRKGTKKDVLELENTFSWLNFKVIIKHDVEAADVLKIIKSQQNMSIDCFVCCILSHGFYDGVYGNDGKKVRFDEMIAAINGSSAPWLFGKPKLFFIQACQVNEVEKEAMSCKHAPIVSMSRAEKNPNNDLHNGIIWNDEGAKESMLSKDSAPERNSVPKRNSAPERSSAPKCNSAPEQNNKNDRAEETCNNDLYNSINLHEETDICFSVATTPGNPAYRHRIEGSLYIQTLCHVLREHAPSMSLTDMLLKLNYMMAEKKDKTYNQSLKQWSIARQMSSICYNTMRMPLYFKPKELSIKEAFRNMSFCPKPNSSYERNEGLQHNPCDFKNQKIPSENIDDTYHEEPVFKLSCGDVQLMKETSSPSTSDNNDINGRRDHSYSMNSGICYIIDNSFSCEVETQDGKSLGYQEGTKKDVDQLLNTFSWLNFEVIIKYDVEACDVLKIIKSQQNMSIDCFVCCILSHGFYDGVYGNDRKKVRFDEMIAAINGSSAPWLLGRPKLFFIQACQVNEVEKEAMSCKHAPLVCMSRVEKNPNNDLHIGIIQVDEGAKESMLSKDSAPERNSAPKCNSAPEQNNKNDRAEDTCNNDLHISINLHEEADMCFSVASTPGNPAYRHRIEGSLYIQTLCHVLREHAPSMSLTDMLLKLNYMMAEKKSRISNSNLNQELITKQISSIRYNTLRMPLYFKPKD